MTSQNPFVKSKYILPFTGRANEVAKLESLWKEAMEYNELRIAYVQGEAGIGKSRLVEEVRQRIESEGGLVVYFRAYADFLTSVVSCFSRSLLEDPLTSRLLPYKHDQNLADILTALRRLSQLRLVTVIMEDIHLLTGEALHELAAMLDGLWQQPMAIICTMRPAKNDLRALLQQYTAIDVVLGGIAVDDIRTMCAEALGGELQEESLQIIAETTCGVPLAIRTALRNILHQNLIAKGPDTKWAATTSIKEFGSCVADVVCLLAKGYISHITAEEEKAAAMLAGLGEIFSREAAGVILDNADELLERLEQQGVIVPGPFVVTPLPGSTGNSTPMSFSHVLVYQYLSSGYESVEPERMFRVLSADIPLYSVRPFFNLPVNSETLPDIATGSAIMHRLGHVFVWLSTSPDWERSFALWDIGNGLLERCKTEWDARSYKSLQIGMAGCKLFILHRLINPEESDAIANQILSLTENSDSLSELSERMNALTRLTISEMIKKPELPQQYWAEVQRMVERVPEMQFQTQYIDLLASIIRCVPVPKGSPIRTMIEDIISRLQQSDLWTDEMEHFMELYIRFRFLLFGVDENDMQQLRSLTDHIDIYVGNASFYFLRDKLMVYVEDGQWERALEVIRTKANHLKMMGVSSLYNSVVAISILLDACLGESLERIQQRLEAHVNDDGRILGRNEKKILAECVKTSGVLRGNCEWATAVVEGVLGSGFSGESMAGIVMALDVDDPVAARDSATCSHLAPTLYFPMELHGALTLLLGEGNGMHNPDTLRMLQEHIANMPASLKNVQILHIVLASVRFAQRNSNYNSQTVPFTEHLKPVVQGSMGRMLRWLAEHAYGACILPLLSAAEGFLPTILLKEYAKSYHQERYNTYASVLTRDGFGDDSKDVRIGITMLGSIVIRTGSGGEHELRGLRMRTLLGLMVANALIDRPLSYSEFSAIALGLEGEPDTKSRNSINVAIFRMRETIGTDAINTENEVPQLNLNILDIDLIHAHTLLERAEQAVMHGMYNKSTPDLMKAQEIVNGEVPFPGLYDSFFEAVRDDFEYRMRQLVLGVSRWGIEEGDIDTAEKILRRAYNAMPGDDEIAELLEVVLGQNRKRAEVERVRIQGRLQANKL